jgi:hypothetical protein
MASFITGLTGTLTVFCFIVRNTVNICAHLLTGFDITIGDITRNFDSTTSESTFGALVANLNTPDRLDDAVRTDNVNYSFTGFTPGEFFQFAADIDSDTGNTGEDFRNVLFDLNGSDSSDNSLVTVTFDDGNVLSGNLPDFSATLDDVYTFRQSIDIPAPEPSSGYILEFSTQDFNQPWITLTNISTFDSIVEFRLTIGDTTATFDAVAPFSVKSPGISETLLSPDFDFTGGISSDELAYLFGGFEPGKFFQAIDVDFDSTGAIDDYRTIIFDLNGSDSSDNALVTVTFASGATLSGLLPDFPENADNFYSFSQSRGPKPESVPEPGIVLGLMAVVGGGLGLTRKLGKAYPSTR